ncbi:MAG: arginine repressor [Ruminococcus sp.]|nr:arginine repressor [Ruminococcus sp.]
MKNRRQEIILELIAEQPIGTQELLIELLAERGIKTTQATLSRDIQQLMLIKQRDENGDFRYVLPAVAVEEKSLFAEAVLSVDYAMNVVVLKCRAGMAQGTCVAIDAANHQGIVGTLAGDDTIFVLVRTEADAKKLSKKFRSELIPRR